MPTVYGKDLTENIPAHTLRALKKAIENEEDD
jgi:hypothetical protein